MLAIIRTAIIYIPIMLPLLFFVGEMVFFWFFLGGEIRHVAYSYFRPSTWQMGLWILYLKVLSFHYIPRVRVGLAKGASLSTFMGGTFMALVFMLLFTLWGSYMRHRLCAHLDIASEACIFFEKARRVETIIISSGIIVSLVLALVMYYWV